MRVICDVDKQIANRDAGDVMREDIKSIWDIISSTLERPQTISRKTRNHDLKPTKVIINKELLYSYNSL